MVLLGRSNPRFKQGERTMKQLLPTTYERCNEAEDPRLDTYVEIDGYVDEYGQHYEKSRCYFYTRERLVREYENHK